MNLRVIYSLVTIPFALSTILALTSSASTQVNADEIIRKSYLAYYYGGDDGRAQVQMRLINKEGKERIRKMVVLRKDFKDGGEQKYYIHFSEPGDVRDTTFMVWKNIGKDDDRWLFIPAVRMVKRIAANDKRSSFVGSDFTYEDISGREVGEDKHEFVKEDAVSGKPAYVIKSTPKDKVTEYAYVLRWVDKATFLHLKEEYYDKQGELYRVFTADKVETIQGIPTVTVRTMKNVKTGHRTVVTFSGIKYNLGIPAEIFDERYLQRPPQKWIQ